MKIHSMVYFKHTGDRWIGLAVDKKAGEKWPTIDVGLWWWRWMIYFSEGK